jgi:hypothetical protein
MREGGSSSIVSGGSGVSLTACSFYCCYPQNLVGGVYAKYKLKCNRQLTCKAISNTFFGLQISKWRKTPVLRS